ncbi:putative anthocyanidin reductase [Impatiens glandulifera]|uniref:putative anthocyanidin reductase n=1 Tax=Impatiens glandulifera TaxID=253017 RepID=UPI001FB0DAB7|nr:putative anthocyanidin reductase [Impatiens glandulifera]
MEEREMKREEDEDGTKIYCVTGANGYIGSWLVKSLLLKGHTVHAAVRHPDKCLHLLPIWGGEEISNRLRIFKADLFQEGSFDECVSGCHGVFHVAASMDFTTPLITTTQQDLENYVQSHIIEPAVKGTLNLLNSCSKALSVKRIVFTSSISTMTGKDSNGNRRNVVDESCWTPINDVLSNKTSGWVYSLSKLQTEKAAFKYAGENGLDLVSIITTTVGGPFLTSTVPSSIQVLLSPITGNPKFAAILEAVNSRMGSVGLVHIEDVCNGHIFLMEHSQARGRYICCAQTCLMSELFHHLAKESSSSSRMLPINGDGSSMDNCEISSEKLKQLGFTYKYSIQDIMNHTVSFSTSFGFLPPNGN